MEYLAFANQLRLPHWLIIAGVALVLFGAIGIFVRRTTDSQVAPDIEDRSEPSRVDETEG
jgi:hypothetical protein